MQSRALAQGSLPGIWLGGCTGIKFWEGGCKYRDHLWEKPKWRRRPWLIPRCGNLQCLDELCLDNDGSILASCHSIKTKLVWVNVWRRYQWEILITTILRISKVPGLHTPLPYTLNTHRASTLLLRLCEIAHSKFDGSRRVDPVPEKNQFWVATRPRAAEHIQSTRCGYFAFLDFEDGVQF